LAQEKDIGLATAHEAVREKLNLFPYKIRVNELKSVHTLVDFASTTFL
jgi:hypothetical protein